MRIITSENTYTEVPDADVNRLVGVAQDAGLEENDVDEAVHDCCDATASRRVNNDGPLLEMPILQASDVAYRKTSSIGSEVNNSGLRAQVAFLIAELGTKGAEEALDELCCAPAQAA